jgi:hypothetical protein
MKSFCLPPKDVEKFKLALKSKAINIADLINMSTEKRTELLRQYAGDLAPEVNHLFEQKLVLKNRIQGMKNWASKVGEIGRYSPEKKAQIEKMIAEYKDKQFERTFNPKENESFLNDLADAKLGTHVTKEQAKQIYDLATKAEELKKNYREESGWTNDADRIKYGMAQIGLDKYVEALKSPELSLRELAKNRTREFKEDWKSNPTLAIGKLIKDSVVELDRNSIAVVASIDNSFIGRQGLKILLTHPTVWAKSAGKSFTDAYKALRSKHGDEVAKDILHADLVSQPNYMNGTYQKAGLLAKFEEQYPTSHPARIPYVGRAFKASEVAFTNSALRMRVKTFDLLHEIAKKNGVEMTDALVKDIGKVVNGLTSRADIGLRGQTTSLFLWAPRMMWANVQVLTGHGLGGGLKTAFARKQAALNLVKITSSIATVAAVLNTLDPGSVETDPRSSDFMKYRKGNTRIDLTGGMGSYVTFTARALAGLSGLVMENPIPAVKNTQTKIISELNTGSFRDGTVNQIGLDFLFNKTTPLVRTAGYLGSGQTFEGKKPSLKSTASELLVPIPLRNLYQNFGGDYPEGEAIAIIGSILDLVGINANTYQPLSQWETKTSEEMKQLKKRIGEKRFNELNIKYNQEVNAEIADLVKRKDYQKKSEEERQSDIRKIKERIKRKYVPPVRKKSETKNWYD